jgi:hypothetical protein
MYIKEKIREKEIHKDGILKVMAIFPCIFMIYGIFVTASTYSSFSDVIKGFRDILLSPTVLLTDFIKVGGLGVAFIHAAIIGFLMLLLFKYYKLRINGLLIAAFFTVIGFSFFGKNLINIPPIFLGGIFYSRYQKISFKNVVLVIMFGTALSPLVSELMFSGVIPDKYNIPAGIVIGVFIGFIIVPLSSHMLRFHDGFNLYNIGFTAGIIGTVITSLLRNMDIEVQPVYILYEKQSYSLWLLMLAGFVALIIIGVRIKYNGLMDYPKILRHKGRTITDFTSLDGYGLTFINMGIMGIYSLGLVMLLGGVLNGPILAGILTIVGFSAFGKHPKNTMPIIVGVIIAAILFGADLTTTPVIIAILFSTTIAPIAGTFGPFIGIIAGILHFILVTKVGDIHGGMNLYNNGFSGGIVAGFLVPIVDAFKKGE